ncbi:hypothetical protein ABZ413_36630 [Nocardia rhamnosiphila]|uniref:hypothetical protein n=1 Tax=Nocardia rhamnosiphila TaxID=426716 RepID=UPI0033EEC6B0
MFQMLEEMMKHPVFALIALLSVAYMLSSYPEFVIGVVVAVTVLVLIGYGLVRALNPFGRHRGVRR